MNCLHHDPRGRKTSVYVAAEDAAIWTEARIYAARARLSLSRLLALALVDYMRTHAATDPHTDPPRL